MSARKFWVLFSAFLFLGGLLRFWLGFVVFFNQGFAWDMSTFGDWLMSISSNGLDAYRFDPSINYPPVFMIVLQGLRDLGKLFSINPFLLLKLPAILADLAVAGVLAWSGSKWYSRKIALWAAGLYLFIPITWYDSSIWGQVDSISALFMLLSVVLLLDRKPELAALVAMLAILTKPQGALVLFILVPLFIAQLLRKNYKFWRISATAISAVLTFVALAVPWSLEVYVEKPLKSIFLISDIAGLAGQYFSTAGLFPVMTANAYNIWSLVGPFPLADQFHTGRAIWLTDNFTILGIQANWIGTAAFLAVAILVAWRLMRNNSPQNVLTGFALLLVAFYVFPTRVHERYLVQAFAILCLVWAVKAWQRALLVVISVANTINLHAILAQDLQVSTSAIGEDVPAPLYPHHGASPETYGLSWVRMPADFARDANLVRAIVLIQTAAAIYLMSAFIRDTRKKRQ